MADSALVCKSEVVEAAEVTVVSDPRPPRCTATAIVHLDRCFKGERPASELVPVLFDNILPPSGGPYGALRKGVSTIRDPATLPILHRLLQLPSPVMRQEVLFAVRAINSPQSAPSLLKMLDDPYADNAFAAMQALIELAGGGAIDWVPPLPLFRENPSYYAARCREWWEVEQKQAQ